MFQDLLKNHIKNKYNKLIGVVDFPPPPTIFSQAHRINSTFKFIQKTKGNTGQNNK